MSQFEPSSILVTGGAGFAGAHLVEHLLATYPACRVIVLDHSADRSRLSRLDKALGSGRARFVRGGMEDAPLVLALARQAEIVCHPASEDDARRGGPDALEEAHRLAARTVFSTALEAGARQVVLLSSGAVYGAAGEIVDERAAPSPATAFGRAMAAVEEEAERMRLKGLDLRIVRPAQIVGPGQEPGSLLAQFVDHALAGRGFPIDGNAHRRCGFLPVTDLARAITLVMEKGEACSTYNVAGRDKLSIRELAQLVAGLAGRNAWFRFLAQDAIEDHALMLDDTRIRALGFAQEARLRDMVAAVIAERRVATRPQRATPSLRPASVANEIGLRI